MKNYISLTFLLLIIGCSQNKDSKNSESNYNPNGEQTIKYKHLLTYFHGSEDSSSIEAHSLYVNYGHTGKGEDNTYLYTDLLELSYCYINETKTKFPVRIISFYNSLKGFPSSKNIDDIGNIGEPFLRITFDFQNPISSPKAILFQGEGNRKFINMGEALKNFNEKGCKDTLINGIPKFAPLE